MFKKVALYLLSGLVQFKEYNRCKVMYEKNFLQIYLRVLSFGLLRECSSVPGNKFIDSLISITASDFFRFIKSGTYCLFIHNIYKIAYQLTRLDRGL